MFFAKSLHNVSRGATFPAPAFFLFFLLFLCLKADVLLNSHYSKSMTNKLFKHKAFGVETVCILSCVLFILLSFVKTAYCCSVVTLTCSQVNIFNGPHGAYFAHHTYSISVIWHLFIHTFLYLFSPCLYRRNTGHQQWLKTNIIQSL